MDELRRIRFFIPPFIFFLSLFWGSYLSNVTPPPWIKNLTYKDLLNLAVILAGAAIPLGFVINSISITFLRFFFFIIRRGTYEVWLNKEALKRIEKLVGSGIKLDKKWELYGVATFDHGLLDKRLNEWIGRRWTIFNLSAHSCIAIIIAHILAPFLQISYSEDWGLSSIFFIIIFIISAIIAYKHTMQMLDFQSRRMLSNDEGKPSI
jgi:hypothetical protein